MCVCSLPADMLYTFYIFTRRGTCLFYHEWNRPRNTLAGNPEEDRKLMYGLLFSLKQLVNNLSPTTYVAAGCRAVARHRVSARGHACVSPCTARRGACSPNVSAMH